MSQPADSTDFIREHDDAYTAALDNIKEFFRFETRHPKAHKFDDEYYKRAAEVIKQRIDFELRNLHKPYLD